MTPSPTRRRGGLRGNSAAFGGPSVSIWILIYAMVAALSVVTIDALAPRIGISTNGGFAVLAKTVLLILAAVLGSIDAATRSRNMAAVHQAMEKAQAVSQRVFESMD